MVYAGITLFFLLGMIGLIPIPMHWLCLLVIGALGYQAFCGGK